ncbi:MAG TPA: serine/threonine-protein kinase [Gemmatimonadales bacterium]|nr:serine/threonine-protein kinase [Gemmatimonadales bacterium]
MADLSSRLAAALGDRYAIGRELGSGGAAIVFFAHDRKHGRAVALKVLRPEVAASLGAERFLREIRIAAGLTHPHILPVHDSGEAGGLLYYVMPFVEGESLRERMRREGALPLDDALRVAREVADALGYAHSQGVVHRDIKPGNILLVGGHAVVADFGIATASKAALRDMDDVGASDAALTELGLVIGTPAYMSPEQAGARGPVDGRSDLYSLGCVLFEMLTGAAPFPAPTPQAVLTRHSTDPPPSARAGRPSVPVRVNAAVGRVMAKLPADRYRTAAEFVDALEDRESARPVDERPAPSKAGWIVAGAALLLLAAAAVVWSGEWRPRALSGTGVVVLPFASDSAAPGHEGAGTARPEELFANGLEWLPALRAIDGAPVVARVANWRSAGLPDVLRRARALGARYVASGTVRSGEYGDGVVIDLYSTSEGSRLYRYEETDDSGRLARALDGIALRALSGIALRDGLLSADRKWTLSATSSAAAFGHLVQGQTDLFRDDYDGAAAAFRDAIAADPDCGLAYHRLSVAHEWRHDFPAAMAALAAGLAREQRLSAPAAELLQARRYYLLGQGDSAIATFQETVLDRPDATDAWFGLGESLFHYAGYAGYHAVDAEAAFARMYALDSVFAPIHDHEIDLAIASGDRARAMAAFARMRPEDMWRPARAAALALRFGSPAERRRELAQLRTASRATLTDLIQLWLHGPIDAGLADTLATMLTGPDATPEQRVRAAEYRVAALGAQRRWPEAEAVWDSAAAITPFDGWIVQAYFAGLPAERLARPMLDYARQAVDRGESPDFRMPAWDAVQQPFFALVHEAVLDGDGQRVRALRDAIDRAPKDTTLPYRVAPAFRAALDARLALLAADTVRAIAALRQSVSRVAGPGDSYFPMLSMAPERVALARLLAARGDSAGAAQVRESFSETWALADAMFAAGARNPRAR